MNNQGALTQENGDVSDAQAREIIRLQAEVSLLLKWKDEANVLLGRVMVAELAAARLRGASERVAQQLREATKMGDYFSTILQCLMPTDFPLWEVAAIQNDGQVDRRIVVAADAKAAQDRAKDERGWSGVAEYVYVRAVGNQPGNGD